MSCVYHSITFTLSKATCIVYTIFYKGREFVNYSEWEAVVFCKVQTLLNKDKYQRVNINNMQCVILKYNVWISVFSIKNVNKMFILHLVYIYVLIVFKYVG